jgi:hypothetical protein
MGYDRIGEVESIMWEVGRVSVRGGEDRKDVRREKERRRGRRKMAKNKNKKDINSIQLDCTCVSMGDFLSVLLLIAERRAERTAFLMKPPVSSYLDARAAMSTSLLSCNPLTLSLLLLLLLLLLARAEETSTTSSFDIPLLPFLFPFIS